MPQIMTHEEFHALGEAGVLAMAEPYGDNKLLVTTREELRAKHIADAVAAEREAIIQAIESARFHTGKPCGCGECVGMLDAIDIIRKRGGDALHTLEEILPSGDREVTREEWELRVRWAYALGVQQGVRDTLRNVAACRIDADNGEDAAFHAVFRYLEEKEKQD